MKNIKLSKWAKNHGVTYKSAYRYFAAGDIPGAFQLPSGTILVKVEDELSEKRTGPLRVALYCRVSNSENKKNLDTQMERIRSYAMANGYQITHEVKEVGSGINDKRKKLESLLSKNDFDLIIVEHKDRLTRFGFNYIQTLLKTRHKNIEVINKTIDGDTDDIISDFTSIITSFCARIYGKRRSKRKTETLIKEIHDKK